MCNQGAVFCLWCNDSQDSLYVLPWLLQSGDQSSKTLKLKHTAPLVVHCRYVVWEMLIGVGTSDGGHVIMSVHELGPTFDYALDSLLHLFKYMCMWMYAQMSWFALYCNWRLLWHILSTRKSKGSSEQYIDSMQLCPWLRSDWQLTVLVSNQSHNLSQCCL